MEKSGLKIMKPEELKNIEYDFEDDVCTIYVNGKVIWRVSKNELEGKEGQSVKVNVLRINVEKGEFIYAFIPRFKSQIVDILGPLELKDNVLHEIKEENIEWLIGITKFKKPEFSLKDKEVLDKTISDHKRIVTDSKMKIKELEKRIKENEDIIKLLEKLGDKKWK